MQEPVYRTPILDVADVKQCLIAAWSGLQQHVIDEAIDQWRGWLHACVRTDGRHFKHLL